jgi:Carbohydrate-selective porin, OprB family
MTNILSKNFLSPLLIGIAVWAAGTHPAGASPNASPSPTPNRNTTSSVTDPATIRVTNSVTATAITEPSSEQIETASQASEIKPKDWAYQTLQALGTKYGCPSTLAGDKTLSREEFATSLNGCVQSIEQLIARKPRRKIKKRPIAPRPLPEVIPQAPEVVSPPPEPTPVAPPAPPEPSEAPEEIVSQQDLDRLKGLIQSFGAELQGVDTRLQTIEASTKKLQDQSFSTTTKLAGEVIIGINGYNTGRSAGIGASGTTGNVLTDRVRLNFDTSFTGKDRLRTRLQSRNNIAFNAAVTGTNMTQLGYDGNSDNNTSVSLLQYSFPLSADTKIIAETIGSEFNENLYTFNPLLTSSGDGSISRFGRYNPVYRLSGDGASLTVNHKFSDQLKLDIGYAVPVSNTVANPINGAGLFNGSNSIISQLSFLPSKDLGLGLVYARSFSGGGITGSTGSGGANSPFGTTGTTANHYSALASYKLSPGFVISGWAGFIDAKREAPAGSTLGPGSANISNYAVSLAFPDFGSKGNNLAFIVGIPPKLNSRSTQATATAAPVTTTFVTAAGAENRDTSYHIEALYRVKLSDNLAITPGILLITNPEHSSANPTEYVGTIRTTFKF